MIDDLFALTIMVVVMLADELEAGAADLFSAAVAIL